VEAGAESPYVSRMADIDSTTRTPMPTGLKLALDFGPLLVFFAANKFGDVFIATAAFMLATLIAMAVSWMKTRHIPPMLIFTGFIVIVFGGLTLWLQDATFIKLKPTLIYGMFAGILFFGLATKRSYLKLVLGEALPAMDDKGWTKLTRNWALFFVALMGANEVARQLLTTDQWVNFKVWGVTAATFLFAMAQAPLLAKHATPPKA
jgi:intracellular septation protein